MANPRDEDDNQEEDKVAAAYENISKRLDSIRNGEVSDDDEDDKKEMKSEKEDDEDLEEWKGPKPPKNIESEEEEDFELRKVKLKQADADEVADVDSKMEESEFKMDEKEEKKLHQAARDYGPEDKWKPAQNDPLDDEGTESDEEPEITEDPEDEDEGPVLKKRDNDPEETAIGDSFDTPKVTSHEFREEMDVPERRPQPDSLDDLADEKPIMNRPSDEDDYSIPNLKASRHEESMGYNTASQNQSFGESYAPRNKNMDGNDPNNFFSQHSQQQAPKRANKFHLLILIIIGIAVIGFTVYILKGGFGEINLTSQPSPSPSVQATPEATPTPTPEPDRAQYNIRVLNGSGKTGLAATVADKLKGLGYQVDKTGNATNSAFTQTIVRVKADEEAFLPQIVKDLAPDFDAAGNTSLKDEDTVDIEIILGAK